MSGTPTVPGSLYKPYQGLVKISIIGQEYQVPEGNILLRAFQFLAPEDVAHGKFCWNEECQDCRVHFDLGEGLPNQAALSCKLVVQDGMRVTEVAQEIRYCLRSLGLPKK